MANLRLRQIPSGITGHTIPSNIPAAVLSSMFPSGFPSSLIPTTTTLTTSTTHTSSTKTSSDKSSQSASTGGSSNTNTATTATGVATTSGASAASLGSTTGSLLSASTSASGTLGGDASPSTSSAGGISSLGSAAGIKQVKCSSMSCNPKLAAAVFVPVAVVLAILAVGLAFFCMRRKSRNRGFGSGFGARKNRLGAGLAFFGHGAETNYVTPPRSSAGTVSSRSPSMREVDGGSFPSLAAGGAAGAAGLAAARGIRTDSHPDFGHGYVHNDTASIVDADGIAPPPYAPRQNATEPTDAARQAGLAAPAPVAQRNTDPFADPASNPFADEACDEDSLLSGDTAVAVARGEGSRRGARDNASIVSSLRDMDEAGSVHEAMLGVSRGPSQTAGRSGSFRSRSPRPRAES